MNVDCFWGTNILVYAACPGKSETAKQSRSLELIETENFGTSAQVLQEFYVTVTRKAKRRLPPEVALDWIEQFEVLPCLPLDSRLVKVAAEISVRCKISYWDGAILAAAEGLGARIVYSEDLNDGQRYGQVVVRNPFLGVSQQ